MLVEIVDPRVPPYPTRVAAFQVFRQGAALKRASSPRAVIFLVTKRIADHWCLAASSYEPYEASLEAVTSPWDRHKLSNSFSKS